MRVQVDSQRCMGHGMCYALAPEVFSINEDTGFNEMGEFEITEEQRDGAARGVSACPEHAIALLQTEEASR